MEDNTKRKKQIKKAILLTIIVSVFFGCLIGFHMGVIRAEDKPGPFSLHIAKDFYNGMGHLFSSEFFKIFPMTWYTLVYSIMFTAIWSVVGGVFIWNVYVRRYDKDATGTAHFMEDIDEFNNTYGDPTGYLNAIQTQQARLSLDGKEINRNSNIAIMGTPGTG